MRPGCIFRTAFGSSLVDGVAHSAIGMPPSVVENFRRAPRDRAEMPPGAATANPVAVGGCSSVADGLNVRPLPGTPPGASASRSIRVAVALELAAIRDP